MLESIQVAAGAAAGAHIHHGTAVVVQCEAPVNPQDGRRLLLAGAGPIGTVVGGSAGQNMLAVRTIDPMSGYSRVSRVPVGMLRSLEAVYGEALASPEVLSDLSGATEQAIATRAARRTVLALLLTWPKSIRFDSRSLGSPAHLVCLTRFVAASEHALEQASGLFEGDDTGS